MDFLTLILFLVGLVFLILGAEWLVRGASGLAVAIGISPLVVGLTVVAFGTSAPELAVGVRAGLFGAPGETDIALGNVLGSNIANILLILGLASLVAPLIVHRQLLFFDVPVMIGVSVLLFVLSLDGVISTLDGLVLFLGIFVYTGWSIHQSRKQEQQASDETGTSEVEELPVSHNWVMNLALMAGGLAMLVVGSDWLVDGATAVARALGVSELIIGLTIVAVGTSLPEVATTVAASLKGEREMAVGNAVGSNIFNILLILGATSIVASGGIQVSAEALWFDFPVMLAAAVLCLPIFYTDWEITRWEGVLFLGYYVAYLVYLVLKGLDSSLLPFFEVFMLGVISLSVVVLLVLTVRVMLARPGNPAPEGETRLK
jgi:cation:H+ antiporter